MTNRQMSIFRPTTLMLVGIHADDQLHLFRQAGWPMLYAATTIDAMPLIAELREEDPYLTLIIVLAPTDAAGVPTWLFAATLTQSIPTMRQEGMALAIIDEDLDAVTRRRFLMAGCTILPAPVHIGDLERWHACIEVDPPHTSVYAGESQAFREAAAAAYHLLVSTDRAWRLPEVRILLAGFRSGQHRRALDALLLERLGGYQTAKATLQRCADELCGVEGAIIRGMLQGYSQDRIAMDIGYCRESISRRMPAVYTNALAWLNYGIKNMPHAPLPQYVYASAR